MKQKYKWFIGAMIAGVLGIGATSCVDEIKFGNSFLEKAPGGSATQDTIFNRVFSSSALCLLSAMTRL